VECHPFASLVKLKDYPYAVEVDDETFKKNEEIFAFLTEEAEKRGIWVIQMFYNIIVSKPFAEHNKLKTQDRERPIIPIIADYTQKSIAAFIEKYPHVGLLITLGEAMNTIDDDVEWFTQTIIPGVKDGLKALGRTDEVPIVLRAHDTDAKRVMEAALPIYKNLFTMSKYNGESLTTYEPRDSWDSIPKGLSQIGTLHIANVHILANLEPFRYGSPDFIQKSVLAMQRIQGAKGVHVYPQASYWDWPYSADKTAPGCWRWTATGFGTMPGPVMPGKPTATVLKKSNIGAINWAKHMVVEKKGETLLRLTNKPAKLLRNCCARLVYPTVTVRPCCWVCSCRNWLTRINMACIPISGHRADR
jgi:hypothetical protein